MGVEQTINNDEAISKQKHIHISTCEPFKNRWFSSCLAAKSKYFFCPAFIVAGTNMSSIIFSALPRSDGGNDRLINSAGLSEKVPSAKAGMASMQNCKSIRCTGIVAAPANNFQAGVSYISVMSSSLLGRSVSCSINFRNCGVLRRALNLGVSGK